MALARRVIALAAILQNSLALVEFAKSKLFDEKDFSVQVVSIPNYCDVGCRMYVSMPDSSADIAKQIQVHDYIYDKYSLYDISKMKMTDQKGYFEIEMGNTNLNIINTNTKYATAPMAVWVVRKDSDFIGDGKVYDARALSIPPESLYVITVMSAEPFTIQSNTDGASDFSCFLRSENIGTTIEPMEIVATHSGFDAITNENDACIWVIQQLSPEAPTNNIQTRVYSPLLSFFYNNLDYGDTLTSITGDVGEGELDFSGISYAASPGYIGCKGNKYYRSSLYNATSSLYDVSITSVLNTDTTHSVTISDRTNDKQYEWYGTPTGGTNSEDITLQRTNNLDISWTRNDQHLDQSFLVRLTPFNEMILTTPGPTTEATTEPVDTTTQLPEITTTQSTTESTIVTATESNTSTTSSIDSTTTEFIPDQTTTVDSTTTELLVESTTSFPIPDSTTSESIRDRTSTIVIPDPTTSAPALTTDPVPDHTSTTSVSIHDPTTTELVPELSTTSESAEPSSTQPFVDRSTTVFVPTTTKPELDRSTTAVLPDSTSTEPVSSTESSPAPTTTVLIPDPTTSTITESSPALTTTVLMPVQTTTDRTTSVAVPDPTTTEKLHDRTTTIVMPDPTTTEPPVDQTTTESSVDRTTTILLPNPTTTDAIHARTTTVVIADPTTTEPVPDLTTTVVVPDPTTAEPDPIRTSTNSPPDRSTTVVVPDPTTSDPVPIRTTTGLSPVITSTESPIDRTTTDSANDLTTTDPVSDPTIQTSDPSRVVTVPTGKPPINITTTTKTKPTATTTKPSTGHPKDISTTTLRPLVIPTGPTTTTAGGAQYGSSLIVLIIASVLLL